MSHNITRRDLLRCIVVTAVAPAAIGCSDDTPTQPTTPSVRPVTDGKQFFPQSVASGDPRPDSVILWTRITGAADPVTLALQVSTTDDFKALVVDKQALPVSKDHDGTIKVKVTGLSAKTTYYYRFVYEKDGTRYGSQVGRTKTAPAAGDDTPVSFVVASCQDYVGRYYNSWAHLVASKAEVDFVLFIGDYVYETTGDPGFQKTAPDRAVKFAEPADAIDLGDYQAAKSVGNYRDLYKTFRTDPMLQKVHELFPFINIWDDHEYSDDCWGDVATYTDGLKDERDTARRTNAERVFYEFIPFDPPEPVAQDGAIDPGALPTFPKSHIYRDFDFGKHLKIVATDYRTYRPDHLVPEDAFPAQVILDDAAMQAAGLAAAFASDSFAYVNIDDAQYATQKANLKAAVKVLLASSGITGAPADARADALVKGNTAVVFLNGVLDKLFQGNGKIDPVGKPRGLAWIHFGKQDLYGLRGSRYFMFKATFDAYAAYLYAKTQGASENAFGAVQEGWLKDTVAKSQATHAVIASSVSPTMLSVDLSNKADVTEVPQQKYLANADQWDGFPNKKKELLGWAKSTNKNVTFVAGDIHCALASTEEGVPVLTTPAISSGTFRELLTNALAGAGYGATTAVYKYAVTQLDDSFKEANPNLIVSKQQQGYLLVRATGTELTATFQLADESLATKRLYDDPSLAGSFKPTVVIVQNGALRAG